MKLSLILSTLASANLPPVTSEQLQQLVGTLAGKAFAEDISYFAAGDIGRRRQLAAVVGALAPAVGRAVEDMGLQFDLLTIIAGAKRDGDQIFDIIAKGTRNVDERIQTVGYLRGLGLRPNSSSLTGPPANVPGTPPYYSFKIFAATSALCVSEARTRTGNQYTVQLEGALALPGGVRKAFDWRNRIIVQLTVQEAYLVLALLENLIPNVKFDGHGREHDKSLHIEFQQSHYFVRLIQRGRAAVAVPVRAVDAIPIVALLYKQLMRNEPHLLMADVRLMVERMATMLNSAR